MTDEGLARRAARGDADAFREIYGRYADRLWREVLWPYLREPARCEDALCETFLAALQALPRFRPGRGEGEGLWAWLKQIARRKALDELRRQGRRGRFEERVRAEPEADPPGADPQRVLLRREAEALEAQRVGEIMAQLNPRYAEVLRLRLQEQRPREECAEHLGVRVGTLDVVLYRAVRAFRAAWVARYGAPPQEE